jgi:hypothetical protein
MLLQLDFSSYLGWIIWFGTGEILKWVISLFLLISFFASWFAVKTYACAIILILLYLQNNTKTNLDKNEGCVHVFVLGE